MPALAKCAAIRAPMVPAPRIATLWIRFISFRSCQHRPTEGAPSLRGFRKGGRQYCWHKYARVNKLSKFTVDYNCARYLPPTLRKERERIDWIRTKARYGPCSLGLRTKASRKGRSLRMMIIGCDFHPSWQQVSWLDTETGETGEQKLVHASGDAKAFYQQLAAPALIGVEATGNSQWFIELVQDMGHEIWIGDAAQIRASYVRKQKTDKRDAAHILKLVVEGRFPRLWTPDREQRDLRQLVLHRHKLVEMRSRVKNELQHLSLNKGMQKKRTLWSQAGQKVLRELPLKPWAACRRGDLLGLLGMLNEQVRKLDEAVQLAG